MLGSLKFNFSNPLSRRAVLALIAAAFLPAGCMVGPNYSPPETKSPATFSELPAAATQPAATRPAATTQPAYPHQVTLEQREADLSAWWNQFNDPELNSLITQAMSSNLDVQLAISRVQQSRAVLNGSVANLLPEFTGNASFNRQKPSYNPGGHQEISNNYLADIDASWEIDIFGGIRRGIESASASLAASEYDQQDALVVVTSEVALDYVQLRGIQRQIEVVQNNISAQQGTVKMTQQLFNNGNGFGNSLAVQQAQAQLATTEALLPPLKISEDQTIHALSVLLGEEPGTLMKTLSVTAPIPHPPSSVPVGMPADLLWRRPDIRSAEESLHAATAQIGVAVSNLFPTFTLTGSGGFSSNHSANWLDVNSLFYQFGPQISWDLWDFGRVNATIDQDKALADQALITYKQTVLTALQETEDALIALQQDQIHREQLAGVVVADQKVFNLSMQLYQNGLDTFLDVLTAQQALLSAQDSYVLSLTAVDTDLITLYNALGGGWEATPP
ncbi:MAG TPA: efflux transporter outer membrane subunit [Phycisphaerae bacterium]|nr:efflux transporter outer membrane subunit [Phycisphaerae bacterium]